MSRYRYTEIISDKRTSKKNFRTTDFPKVEPKDSDVVYYAKYDDTIMTLAYRFYGDISLWWIIARANGFQGKTRFQIGQKIIIPTEIGDVGRKLSKFNFNT